MLKYLLLRFFSFLIRSLFLLLLWVVLNYYTQDLFENLVGYAAVLEAARADEGLNYFGATILYQTLRIVSEYSIFIPISTFVFLNMIYFDKYGQILDKKIFKLYIVDSNLNSPLSTTKIIKRNLLFLAILPLSAILIFSGEILIPELITILFLYTSTCCLSALFLLFNKKKTLNDYISNTSVILKESGVYKDSERYHNRPISILLSLGLVHFVLFLYILLIPIINSIMNRILIDNELAHVTAEPVMIRLLSFLLIPPVIMLLIDTLFLIKSKQTTVEKLLSIKTISIYDGKRISNFKMLLKNFTFTSFLFLLSGLLLFQINTSPAGFVFYEVFFFYLFYLFIIKANDLLNLLISAKNI